MVVDTDFTPDEKPKRLEVTPEMSAYAIYDNLTRGLAMVEMLSTEELQALKVMLSHYRWTDEVLEKKVVLSMLDYVNAELVSDQISSAAK